MYRFDKIDLNAHKDKIEEVVEMLMCHAKECDHDLYKHVKIELYEMEHGKKLTEEKAIEWVKEMEPVGMHWTIDETTEAMQKMGYNCDKIEYFIVSNMMFNDYYDLVKDDEEMALKLAYRWLDDKDAKKDKLYEYWKYIIKRD